MMSWLEKVNQTFKSAISNFRAFLHEQQWREALIFLFFVLLAFGFWILQSLQEDYEINITIPIRYKNIPPDITFVQPPPEKITARVRDRGSILLNYTFGRSFSSIDVNMRETSGNTGFLQVEMKTISDDIFKQLISTTSLITFDPQQIEVQYSQRAHKQVPVSFLGTIQTQPGYAISGDILLSHNTVEAYSHKEMIDTLSALTTIPIEIKNANKTIERIVKIQPLEGMAVEPEMITVTIPIEEFTEKSFEIPIRFLNVPTQLIIRAFPSTIKLNAFVPLSRYKELTADEFAIEIDYRELEDNITGTIPVKLTTKPTWVETTSLHPDKIEFIFEQNRIND